jgi:AcrR family transcriptional regulator
MKTIVAMPARRARNAEAARAVILQAAEDVFSETGFAGARIDEIAEKSGYNKSLIFQYFGDKQGLYRAVIQRFKTEVDQVGEQMLATMGANWNKRLTRADVRSWIKRGVGWVFDYYRDHTNLVRILLWECADNYRTMNALWREDDKVVWAGPVRTIFTKLKAKGLIRRGVDPILAVINLFNLTLNYHATIRRYQYVLPDQALTSSWATTAARTQIIDLIVNGLMTCEPKEKRK